MAKLRDPSQPVKPTVRWKIVAAWTAGIGVVLLTGLLGSAFLIQQTAKQCAESSPPLTDVQKMEIAADYLARQPVAQTIENRSSGVYVGSIRAIPYSSGRDLMDRNPDCCHIGSSDDFDYPKVRGSSYYKIDYNVNYADKRGITHSLRRVETVAVAPCGIVVSNH